MFPKASQTQFALTAPWASVLFFLLPQLVGSTSSNNSGTGRQDPIPSQSSLETNETVRSSLRDSVFQDDAPNPGFRVHDDAQQDSVQSQANPNPRTWNPDQAITSSNQQVLDEIRQIRAQMDRGGQKSHGRNILQDQRHQQVFDAELSRLVQQQEGEVKTNPESPGNHSRLSPQPDDRFVEKKEGPSMLAPLNSDERNRNNFSRRGGFQNRFQNRQLTPQKADERFSSPPLERQVRNGNGERAERPSSLRGMARRLDQIAADLEEAQMYGQADEIRATAQELWKSARHLKTPHGPDRPHDQMPGYNWID